MDKKGWLVRFKFKLLLEQVYFQYPLFNSMAPIWPFKKKPQSVELSESTVVEYSRGGDGQTQAALDDRSHIESADFQAAMSALSVPEESGDVDLPPKIENVALPKSSSQTPAPQEEWLHHSDGYWYQKKADGSFDSTPYVDDGEGNKVPYSA